VARAARTSPPPAGVLPAIHAVLERGIAPSLSGLSLGETTSEAAARATARSRDPWVVDMDDTFTACLRATSSTTELLLQVPPPYRGVVSELGSVINAAIDDLKRTRERRQRLRHHTASGTYPSQYTALKMPTFQVGSHVKADLNTVILSPLAIGIKALKDKTLEGELKLADMEVGILKDILEDQALVGGVFPKLREVYARLDHSSVGVVEIDEVEDVPMDVDNTEVTNLTIVYPADTTVKAPATHEYLTLVRFLPHFVAKFKEFKGLAAENRLQTKERRDFEKKRATQNANDAPSQRPPGPPTPAGPGNNTSADPLGDARMAAMEREMARLAKALDKRQKPPRADKPPHGKKWKGKKPQTEVPAPSSSVSNTYWAAQLSGVELSSLMNGIHRTEASQQEEGEEKTSRRLGGSSNARRSKRKRGSQEGEDHEGQEKGQEIGRGAKRREAVIAESVLRKSWTFGRPGTYPNELTLLSQEKQVNVLLQRADIRQLAALRFKSRIHVLPGVVVPVEIQHDLSSSLKFMFEQQIDPGLITEAYADLVRRIRWRWEFNGQVGDDYDPDYDLKEENDTPPPRAASNIELGLKKGRDYLYTTIESVPENSDPRQPKHVTVDVKRAQKFMITNDLVVTNTDKNLGVAVISREWIEHASRQTFADQDNYAKLSAEDAMSKLTAIADKIDEIAEAFSSDEGKQIKKFLVHTRPLKEDRSEWRYWKKFIPEAYCIPKIHKSPWKARPIVPGFATPQNPSSKVLSKTLRPYIDSTPWVMQGSKDFVIKLDQTFGYEDGPYSKFVKKSGCTPWLITADVVAFYPSIPLEDAQDTLYEFVREVIIPQEAAELNAEDPETLIWLNGRREFLFRIIDIALSNPIFTHLDEIVEQLRGLPMGFAGSPDVANVWAMKHEVDFLPTLESGGNVPFYGRYLDDIFAIVLAETPDQALEHVKSVSFGPVELAWETPSKSVNWLDLTLEINKDSELIYYPFTKAMSHRERIPWTSAHPFDVKRGTFYSEMSRLATLCSKYETYVKFANEAVALYVNRGYPLAIVNKWKQENLGKRWKTRLDLKKTEPRGEASPLFCLKTFFNDAWKYVNVHELQDIITTEWRRPYATTTLVDAPNTSARFEHVNPSRFSHLGPSIMRRHGTLVKQSIVPVELTHEEADFQRAQATRENREWSLIWSEKSRFIVSRKRTTQLWDLTRAWNKTVLENWLNSQGLVRPGTLMYRPQELEPTDD
jgi:hypothetical protein